MVTNTIAQEEIMGEMKQCIHGDSYEETKEKIKYLADNFSQFNNLNLSSLVEEYSWDKLTSKIYNEIQK